MPAIDLDGPGAIYIRISEDDQKAERQKSSTTEWIVRHGGHADGTPVYEDLGWKRHQADYRPEFQTLIKNAEEGRIRWIVCDALDRFGMKNKGQLLAYLYRLQEAGCRLYTVNDKEWTGTDLLTLIEAGMEGEKSEKELRDKSERVIEAMRIMAGQGTWLGGRIPFGCDVAAFCMESTGRLIEQWRVRIVGRQSRLKIDMRGNERVYDGKNNFPATELDEILQLRPTQDEARLEVIRNTFQRFASETINFNQLATQLEAQKLPPPPYSKGWQYFHVREMLVNPVYIGKPGWNRRTHGQYTQWKDGRRQSKKPGGGMKHHVKDDWITPDEPIFPPIVDPELFEKVQAKIEALPTKKRSPKSAKMWLAGLVYCANCGKAMCGKKDSRTGKPQYICSTYVNARGPRKDCGCFCNIVSHEQIEEKLREYLATAGVQLADLIGGIQKARVGTPNALKSAIERAVQAHRKMMDAVGAEFVRLSADITGTGEPMTVLELPDLRWGDGRTFVPKWDTDELERQYRNTFEDEKLNLEIRRDDLLGEQEELLETLTKIPSTATRALAKVQAQIDQNDAAIRETDAKLENAADAFEKANGEYERLNREWQQAQAAVETEVSTRRKAELVRKVVARINLRFKPTGKKRPVSELAALEWVPVGAEVSPRSPSSPHPLGTQCLSSSRGSGFPSP